MRILHICNDFTGSKVHSNLYKKLAERGCCQVVYTYFNGKEKKGKNSFSFFNTEIIYDDILNPYLRKIYPFKVWWVYKQLIKKINPMDFDCVHATTLFSDGGIALELYKKYGIPYIVAVRTTDLSTYIDKSKILWSRGREILLHASKIVLINNAYQEKLKKMPFSCDIWNDIKNKVVIQPNGIDEFWIDNISREPKRFSNEICYVGSFIKRKNVPRLIRAMDMLHADFPDVKLNLIGGGGSIENEDVVVKKMAEERPYVSLIGKIYDKGLLIEQFRKNSIFAMPSWSETFGLVYIEALTQNLRLLYSENEGVDGLLDNVGVAVDPFSVESIRNGLRNLIENYGEFYGNAKVDFSTFDWNSIANRYVGMFADVSKKI